MRIICSYCRAEIGEKAPYESTLVSHGLCECCAADLMQEFKTCQLGEYLDQFEEPVAQISEAGRVIAANEAMAKMLGREDRDLFGLLGGEVMECAYAQLPEGCGETQHCYACSVRRTVQETLRTGRPAEGVQAYLRHKSGIVLNLEIATELVDATVVLRVLHCGQEMEMASR